MESSYDTGLAYTMESWDDNTVFFYKPGHLSGGADTSQFCATFVSSVVVRDPAPFEL